MPRHCSVYGCRSNYDGPPVFTFSLPKDKTLKSQWLRKIPTDLSKLKHPIICVKHFREEDVILTDTVPVKGVLKTFPRKLPKLKEGSLPCIFPNAPHYLSTTQRTSRRLIDAENESVEAAIKHSLISHEAYLQKDTISSIDDVYKFLNNKKDLFKKWVLIKCDNKVLICLMSIKDDIPNVEANITVYENLESSAFLGKVKLTKFPFSKAKLDELKSFNILEQFLYFIEQEVDNKLSSKYFNESVIDHAVELLEK